MTGKEVKKMRESLSLSRMGFAERAGVSYHALVKWEVGRSNPSRHSLEKIEKFLK